MMIPFRWNTETTRRMTTWSRTRVNGDSPKTTSHRRSLRRTRKNPVPFLTVRDPLLPCALCPSCSCLQLTSRPPEHLLEDTSVAPPLPRRPPYMQSVYSGLVGAIAWSEYRKALGNYHEGQRRQRQRRRVLRRLRRDLWYTILSHKARRIRGVMEKRRERAQNRRTVEIKVPRDPDYQGVERNVNLWRQRRFWRKVKLAAPGVVALRERVTLEIEFVPSRDPLSSGKDAKYEIRWVRALHQIHSTAPRNTDQSYIG